MKDLYPDTEDSLPLNMPEPRGNPIYINTFVDSGHARNIFTRRLHTGIMIFINIDPIQWYSKKQNNIENSTFGEKNNCAKNRNISNRINTVQVENNGSSFI